MSKRDYVYVHFRNTFSTVYFPLPKDFLENRTKKRDEALKEKEWAGNETWI